MHPRSSFKISGILGALLALILSACDREKSGESFDGRTISKIEIRYDGENMIGESRLRNLIAVKAGDKYTPESFDTSIKTLWESGVVDDVAFFVEPDGEEVIAKLKTRPPMGPPRYIGNTAFSDLKLAREGGLTSGEPITVEALETARLKLKAFYVSNGYADVEVSYRPFSEGEPDLEDSVFVIEEGTHQPKPKSSTDHNGGTTWKD
jgi:outer membrane protein assembly factor BamA